METTYTEVFVSGILIVYYMSHDSIENICYSHWFTGTQNVEQVHRVVGPSGNARKKAR